MKLEEVTVEGVTLNRWNQAPAWIYEVVRWMPSWVAVSVDAEVKHLFVHHSVAGMFFLQLYEGQILVEYHTDATTTQSAGFENPTAAANFIRRHCQKRVLQEVERILATANLDLPEILAKRLEG